MEKAVAICGQICSGKTAVISYLAQTYSWDIISFSAYIKELAAKQELPATRETYQQLGQTLYTNMVPAEFLGKVIAASGATSEVQVFDSIRHVSIANALREIYPSVVVIYLDTSFAERQRRFASRQAVSDKGAEFLELNREQVESDIENIRDVADYVINGDRPFEEIITEVKCLLKRPKLREI